MTVNRALFFAPLALALGCSETVAIDDASPPLVFPIEVLGAPGSEARVTFDIDPAIAARSTTVDLELLVHNVVEPDSAELVVNDTVRIDLSDPSGPFLCARGCVRAGRVPIDAGALRGAAANDLVFRYTRQVQDLAAVSGFRVLSLSISAGDVRVDPPSRWDDPAEWRPIRADPDALERGRRLFRDESLDGGPTCARCHADSGADLAYFAFSDKSIVERAMFHELSREQAEDVASYIRSLGVAPEGRPFDAPFQPGEANHGAAGAGRSAVLAGDATFAGVAFGTSEPFPPSAAWDWPSAIDTWRLPTPVEAPTWHRWLPREIEDRWFTARSGALAAAERALAEEGTLESATRFMQTAIDIAKDFLIEDSDYEGQIELMRFAAVKLWDWSRRRGGFGGPDHGLPDAGPAYPYEVGFAFLEAWQNDARIAEAIDQVLAWWWAQLAANPGRGMSDGRRPLNYRDVLDVAEAADAGPATLAFVHLYGSWEESRGPMADRFGTEEGPVRLLHAPARALAPDVVVAIFTRFFARETEHLSKGGTLSAAHLYTLGTAWSAACPRLLSSQRDTLRALAPAEVSGALAPCD